MPEMEDYHFHGSLKDNPKRKLHSLINKFGPHKLGGLIATLVVAIMLPVTLIAVQQQQNVKQRAAAQWEAVASVPAGNIGVNKFELPDSSNQHFEPLLVEYSNSLHVFVIGEGGTSAKPQGDWYNLYVSSTDQPDTAWGGFRWLGGNASSAPEFKKEGDNLKVRVRGFSFSTLGPDHGIYYSKTRSLFSDFQEGGEGWLKDSSGGWSGITPGEQREVSFTKNGITKLYRASTKNGRIVIEAKLVESTPTPGNNNGTPPTNTPAPNVPIPTVAQDTRCNDEGYRRKDECRKSNGTARQASRCSNTLGCTRAFYDPISANSCGNAIAGTVAYAQDHGCSFVAARGSDDTANTPCYTNDDNNRSVVSPGEAEALKRFYESNTVTGTTRNGYCGAQSGATNPTPTPTSYRYPTATPTGTRPTVTPACLPGSCLRTTLTPTPSQPGITCGRCSNNYPGQWADFRTRDACPYSATYRSNFSQTAAPIDGTIRYTPNDARCVSAPVITNAGVVKSYNPWVIWVTGTNLTSPLTIAIYNRDGSLWGYGTGVAYGSGGTNISFSLPSNTPPGGSPISIQIMKGSSSSARRSISLL